MSGATPANNGTNGGNSTITVGSLVYAATGGLGGQGGLPVGDDERASGGLKTKPYQASGGSGGKGAASPDGDGLSGESIQFNFTGNGLGGGVIFDGSDNYGGGGGGGASFGNGGNGGTALVTQENGVAGVLGGGGGGGSGQKVAATLSGSGGNGGSGVVNIYWKQD